LTGNLDLKTGAEIHDVLRRINEKTGITVVVVTHDPRLAQKMPVKLVLEEGKLVPYEPNDERVRKRIPSDVFERVEETSDLMGKQMEGHLDH
jgi:lipoprotein-releasing system ATP-binding protein